MTERVTPYEQLEIVGYTPVPAPIGRPCIVNMVFRRGQECLLTPYRLTPEGVLNGSWDTMGLFASEVKEGYAAALPEPISPKYNYLLWIDKESNAYYQPVEMVLNHLRTVSLDLVAQAENALRLGQLDHALTLAQNATRVDEENVYSLVVSAAAYKLLGKTSYVELLRGPAQEIVPGFPFDHHVENLLHRAAPIAMEASDNASYGEPAS